MNDLGIIVQTNDNRIQAYGYDPKFYKSVDERNADITNDLNRAKEAYGDTVAAVSVSEWSADEQPSGNVYASIDEALAIYNTNQPIEAEIIEPAKEKL
jgi:ribosome-associated translation inhibitor RaiA